MKCRCPSRGRAAPGASSDNTGPGSGSGTQDGGGNGSGNSAFMGEYGPGMESSTDQDNGVSVASTINTVAGTVITGEQTFAKLNMLEANDVNWITKFKIANYWSKWVKTGEILGAGGAGLGIILDTALLISSNMSVPKYFVNQAITGLCYFDPPVGIPLALANIIFGDKMEQTISSNNNLILKSISDSSPSKNILANDD